MIQTQEAKPPLFRVSTNLNRRSFDWQTLDRVVSKYKHEWVGFDAKALVEDERNILVTDGEENFGLFEYTDDPKVYYGHYLFKARGPDKTFEVAKNLLGYFFKTFDAKEVIGLTPIEHKGAILLNNKLGLTFHRVVDTEAGPHYEVSIKREEFQYE